MTKSEAKPAIAAVNELFAKRRKEPGRGTRWFSWSDIQGKFGVASLVLTKTRAAAVVLP